MRAGLPVHKKASSTCAMPPSAGQRKVGKMRPALNMQDFSSNVSFFFYATLMKKFLVAGFFLNHSNPP
jgi:hypothetical protein